MFRYQGLIDQVGEDRHWGWRAYHLDLSVHLSPCRVLLGVSDLNSGRAWSLGNFLFDILPDGSAVAAAFPADKQWGSNMFEEYMGTLSLGR